MPTATEMPVKDKTPVETSAEAENQEEGKEALNPQNGKECRGGSTEVKGKYEWITDLRDFIKTHRLEFTMWMSRLATLFLITFTIFPFFGGVYTFSRRALICNFITSGIRLYQRLPRPFVLSKEMLGMLLLEDAFHYVLYSVTFIFLGHITFCLVPIFCFCVLHIASFSLKILEVIYGPSAKSSGLGTFFHVWTSRTQSILKLAAISEIFIMILIIFHCFRGGLSFLTPIVYYRFLSLRYISKRNQNTRLMMRQMRMAAEIFMASGKCPGLISNAIKVVIMLLCKLSPN